jgi:hypothetical protein
VDVYERHDRPHVLVDTAPLTFYGSASDDRRNAEEWDINVRHDHFHDVLTTAIVAALTDTPASRVTSGAWDPRSDVGIAENASIQQTARSDASTADASAGEPSDERHDHPHYETEVSTREQEPHSPDPTGSTAAIALLGFGIVGFVSLPIAFSVSFVHGFFAAIAGGFPGPRRRGDH